MEYDEFRAMNTDILLAAEGEPGRVARGLAETRTWVGAMEERLTRFSDTSELARLNRSHGSWFHASPELFELAQLARAFYEETDHLFDPAVLDVLEQIGYDKSFEEIRSNGQTLGVPGFEQSRDGQSYAPPIPSSPPLGSKDLRPWQGRRPRPAGVRGAQFAPPLWGREPERGEGQSGVSPSIDLAQAMTLAIPSVQGANHAFSEVQFNPAEHAILLPPGLRLDLGGIAKGWIAERAAHQLATFAEACAVNAGGDMFLVGRPTDEGAWRIALEDPRNPEQTLAVLRVGPGAVATSSVTRRRWQQSGAQRHHVIDPRRRAPAETDWLSVTVVAAQGEVAEVFAKVLLIIGSGGTRAMAARRADLAFVAVDRDGKLWGSDRAKELLEYGIE